MVASLSVRSDARLSYDLSAVDGIKQRLMILLRLVGVGNGELADGLIKCVGRAEVAADGHGISRPCMGACQAERADAQVSGNALGIKLGHVKGTLHVLKLAPVELDAFLAMILSQKDVRGCLHQALADDDTFGLAVEIMLGLGQVRFQ